ncbi:D123-domain-containing protein [Pestalotiopsis sp. NC0098]|nr:D123-domain-containing protein [Pestalotiopsis sp. NC0098]
MPTITNTNSATGGGGTSKGPAPELHFPPITRDHILHCSYDSWFPKYRANCIKSRIIPLTPEFLEYLREDGITLTDEGDGDDGDDDVEWEGPTTVSRVEPEEVDSDSDSDSDDEMPPPLPPNKRFPDLHQVIKDTIAELGGEVAPKLNWTSPKDAAWMSPHQNTVKCTTPDDIYLLLKSSNFITYDLEHAFEDCTPLPGGASPAPFKPVLVLRSFFNPHTALEFRCYVKHRNLVGICQRDLKYYEFLADLRSAIVARISQFFNHKLRYTFPDGNFAFDVYIPEGEDEPLGRVRLIDINAWAPHTDSLLFGWDELNDWQVPGPIIGVAGDNDDAGLRAGLDTAEDDEEDDDEDDDEDIVPELRLVEKEHAAAYNMSSPAYSAHKLPKDVVDASMAGQGGMREFAAKWSEMVSYRDHLAQWERD